MNLSAKDKQYNPHDFPEKYKWLPDLPGPTIYSLLGRYNGHHHRMVLTMIVNDGGAGKSMRIRVSMIEVSAGEAIIICCDGMRRIVHIGPGYRCSCSDL